MSPCLTLNLAMFTEAPGHDLPGRRPSVSHAIRVVVEKSGVTDNNRHAGGVPELVTTAFILVPQSNPFPS